MGFSYNKAKKQLWLKVKIQKQIDKKRTLLPISWKVTCASILVLVINEFMVILLSGRNSKVNFQIVISIDIIWVADIYPLV